VVSPTQLRFLLSQAFPSAMKWYFKLTVSLFIEHFRPLVMYHLHPVAPMNFPKHLALWVRRPWRSPSGLALVRTAI
jgi:hypothetical protein